MKTTCKKCKGEGEIECCECGHCRDCRECDGEGDVECCITKWDVPKDHKNAAELSDIKSDALRCLDARDMLCQLKPERTESYDKMLADTLEELNKRAEGLDK
jgi:hypothetical protein